MGNEIKIKTMYHTVDEKKTVMKIDEKKHRVLLAFIITNLAEIMSDIDKGKSPLMTAKKETMDAIRKEVGTSFRTLTILTSSLKRLVVLTD